MKSVVTIILLVFVAASVTYLVVGEARSKAVPTDPTVRGADSSKLVAGESPGAAAQPANEKQAPVLVAYYFHGTMRCPTCLKMEQYAREAIEETYLSEIENGRVRWEAVNYDEAANEHYLKEFELVASTLVVVSNGPSDKRTWRKLDRTWNLVGDEAAFKRYVVDEVATMLGSGS